MENLMELLIKFGIPSGVGAVVGAAAIGSVITLGRNAISKFIAEKLVMTFERERRGELALEVIQSAEFPVLEEAARVLYRISEVVSGRHSTLYQMEFDPDKLSICDLDGNKLVTSVYRTMRLLGAYALYRQEVASLPPHSDRNRVHFYMTKKIEPIFSSGALSCGSVSSGPP